MPPEEVDRVFAWAQGEAARNSARRQSLAPKPIGETVNREEVMRKLRAAAPQVTYDPTDNRERRQRIERLIDSNGVPPRYRHAAFNGFAAVPAEIRDRYFAASQDVRGLLHQPGILVLLGPRGVGKTYLACALVNTFCGLARHAVYAEAMDYFLQLDAEINARGSVLNVETKYLRPELLVLDAMEERADTPAKDRMLTRLINKRYAGERSTLLLTNETAEKFAERVGSSVADRIRDDGQIIVCDWKSLRGRCR